MSPSAKAGPSKASSNWLALQKKIGTSTKAGHVRKRRKVEHTNASPEATVTPAASAETSFTRGHQAVASTSSTTLTTLNSLPDTIKNGESLSSLRRMIYGELEYTPYQQQPGKYLALDCEMVGVGIEGKESSLARVSLVNYHGAIIMDEFVRQRERVVDYRTEFSGIRPSDMINAKPFNEVQEKVAELIKDRILVGHAIHNDMKALLLSQPRHQTRDTQLEAKKHKLTKSSRPALRHLVQQELNIAIQTGEHSSVTDARATMAIYRIHRKVWDKGHPPISSIETGKKRKHNASTADDAEDESGNEDDVDPSSSSNKSTKLKSQSNSSKERPQGFPGGGRKGVSSGLSTIVKRSGSSASSGANSSKKSAWWKELGNGPGSSKGSMRMKVG
ncbi:hypothetical protein QCA50_005086 [Cerrena zonata]|uniref:RNA exonuclease 4 n=1 Tax=Cerrena zonata TaxID=2478898 RepID=A0AAW0GEA0_9APHY